MQIRIFIKTLFVILLLSQVFACKKESGNNPGPGTGPVDPRPDPPKNTDTVEFRVLVYVDKASVDDQLGGSERIVTSRMHELFRKVTSYWNESSKGKLDKKYRFTLAGMEVYEGSSQSASLRKAIYNDPIDFGKYDVSILFDCKQDNGETGGGGAAHGGGSDNRSVITVIAGPNEKKDIFNDNTYHTLTHELGHYRGVTDLYQYIIAAKDNPISNQKFDPPVCIMNDASAGVWSDYAANCINRAGSSKQLGKDFTDFFGSMYPKRIEVIATVDGQPKSALDVKLYGSRAGAAGRNRDIYPQVFVSGQTNSDGKYILNNTKEYFIPNRDQFKNLPQDLPYGRWFGFLVEVAYGSTKKYVWLPEYEVQMPFFEGKDVYTVNVAF